jgi:hypothetical protein
LPVSCILLIDNCSAQTKLDKEKIPENLIIIYLPPNITSHFQPAHMGMIASLKFAYRVLLLQTLLDIFDQPNGFKKVAVARFKQPKGCSSMVYMEENLLYWMQ